MATRNDEFGASLRWWRNARRFSQLALAGAAEVSSRHISYLENGKARPSREMVVHLATVLDLPLRDRNALLNAAGYAPIYRDHELDAPEMDDVRLVLRTMLDVHSPNPALVVDRRGDLVDQNRAATRLLAELVEPDSRALDPSPNVARIALHPDGIRDRTTNWEAVAATMLQRLEREHAHRPADGGIAELVDEVLSYPGVSELRRRPSLPVGADLIVAFEASARSGPTVRLVTTMMTIGAPYDVTLDELRLEAFFPADDETRDTLQTWDGDWTVG